MEVHHTNFKNAINYFMSNEGTSGNGMNMNENENRTVNNEDTGTSGQRMLTSWEGFQSHMQIATCHQQEYEICEQKSIILDSVSTMSIFHDQELVYDVVKVDNPIKMWMSKLWKMWLTANV